MNLLNRNSSYQVPERPIKILYAANTCREKEKSKNPHYSWTFWRSRRDSNSRSRLKDYSISSRARYDHFDTAPYIAIIKTA